MQIHANIYMPPSNDGAPGPRATAEAAPGTVAAPAPGSEPGRDVRAVPASDAAADAGDKQQKGERPDNRDRDAAAEREIRDQVRQLAARDREVRAHERAHLSAAGGLARGGISLETQRGPDGRQYAVGGEVQVDTSAVAGDPRATIAKARQIRRAALAPAEPSTQDRRVAAQAAAMETAARAEVAAQAGESGTNAGTGERSEADDARISSAGGEPCPMCGGAGHGRGEHVAGNERRLAVALQAVPASNDAPSLHLKA